MADNPQDGDDEEKKDEVPDPYALPEKHKKYINETEYDELKHLFQKYDEDLSGAIDATEMMGVLGDIGVEFDHAGASDLLKKLDTDGSGVLEFNEFLEFIVGIKRGDAWLSDFSGLAERAGETPMGALEKQGQRQGFTVAFRLAESRETVGETYTTFECVLTGRWYEVGEGGGGGAAVAREGARRFVGTGRSVREAKVAAAQAALKQLTAHMPGSDYPPGEIPDKWQAWVVTNIKRGVPPATLLSTLLVKGFFPARCPRLMHRLIAYVSLETLRARHPRPVVEDRLVPAWFNWTETWLKLGVGGEVLVEVLQDHGVVISEHKRLQQRLQRSIRHADMFQEEGAVPVSPDGRRDWFTAVEEGSLWEVRLYIQAGQEVDREERVPRSPVPRFALALAAGLGHLEIMNLLLESGARVNRAGYAGRTALHAACRRGRAAAAARLLDQGADVHLPDRYGNTALHEAARANHPAIVELLAAHEEENVRQVLSGNLVVSDAGPLGGVMARAFDDLMAANLPEHEKPRFHKAWIYQVVDYCWSQIRDTEKHRIGLPPKWLIDDMMKRFDANPDYGFWKGEKTKEKYIPLFEKPDEVVLIMSHCFRQMFLDARNNLGRTALMEACAEDLACSHAAVVRGLCEGHYVNLLLRDCQGRRALELLGTVERRRPGTPSGTGLREEMLIENRDELIFDLREEDRKKKEQEQAQHRENVIKRYMQEARELDPRLWQYVKGHWPVRRALGGWQEREDPDTGNLCYLRDYGASEHEGKRRPERYYHDAEECVFSWEKPPGFAREEKLQQAWSVVRVRSTFVRAVGAWDVLRDGPSGCEFYCRREDDSCRLDAPEEAAWDAIMESSEKLWVSDYSGWEARKDASGNSFWRHPDKGYRWDRPGDAVEPEIFAEMDDDHVQEMKEHAAAQDRDLARLARADARRPFRLAYVPRAYAHAPRAKRLQGWHLCRMEDGWDPRLNHGWWLLEDVEQPLVEEVQAGSKVLCRREGMVGWHDGIIKQKRGKGGHFLVVAFSEWDVVPDICPADYRLPGRPFHFHPDTFAAGWGPDPPPPPPPGGSPSPPGANLGFPPLSGEEWDDFGAMGRLRREVTYQWEEWEDMETGCLYWRHRARHEAQSAARRVQCLFRRRKCRPAPLRWETDAYTFEKPEAVREEELKRNGWATLLRRSQVTGHLFDEDGEKWDELFDPHEEERWYHCRDVGRSQWDKPPEKQDPDKSKAEEVEREFLEVGEKVWFVFPHHQKESVGIIIRVRIDPFTNLRSYDVARDGINEVAIKMVRRGLLTRMVQTEEERQQELEERKWRQEYIEGKAKVAVCILAVALVSFAVLTKETFFSSREMFKHPVILGMYMLVPPNAIMVVGYMIEHSYELYYGVVATAGPGCTLIAFIACAAITAIMGGSVVVAFATERMISSKSRAKTKHIMMGNAISWALGFMTSLKFLVDGSLGPYQKMYCCIKDEAFSDTAPFVTLLFLTGSMCAQIFFYKRANCIIRNQDAHRQELLALGGASAPRTLSYQDTGRAPGEGTALVEAQAQGGGGGGAGGGGAPSLPSALAGADPERAARRRRDRELEAAKTSSRQLAQWGLEMAAVFGALWALMFLNAALRSYSVLTWLYLDVGAAWLVKVSPTAICALLLVRIRAFKKVGFRDAVVTRGGARPGGGKGAGGHPSLFQGSPLEFTKVDSLAKLDQLREKKRQLKGRLAGAEGAEGRALRGGGGGDFGAEYVRPARARGYSQQDYVISAIELA